MTTSKSSTKSPNTTCFISKLPSELHCAIAELDEQIFSKYHVLSKNIATSTHFNSLMQKRGKWLRWDEETHHKILQCVFKDGKLNGEHKKWYSDSGDIMRIAFYKDDKLEGECKRWCFDGGRHYHCFYKDGKLDGEYKEWYEFTGIQKEHSFYKAGEYDGEYKEWYSHGPIMHHLFYKKGKYEGELKVYTNKGELCNWGYYKDNVLDGVYKYFDGLDEDCWVQQLFKDGEAQGAATKLSADEIPEGGKKNPK